MQLSISVNSEQYPHYNTRFNTTILKVAKKRTVLLQCYSYLLQTKEMTSKCSELRWNHEPQASASVLLQLQGTS